MRVIYRKLRQRGQCVNYKRVERLYQPERLQVQRRRHKKRHLTEPHPLGRPSRRNKGLTVVDDTTHESVAVIPDRSMGGLQLTRPLDQLAMGRGLPKITRSDNGPEFVGKAMLNWAHDRSVNLRQIDPGKPNQDAYIESFNGRPRDECLNEHWFNSLDHARGVIESWRREYAKQINQKADTLTNSL
jgi:transposase InsO family protein